MKIEEKKNVFGFMCKLSALCLTLFPMFVSAQEVILPFNTAEVSTEDLGKKPVYAGYPKRVTEQVKSWGEDCVQPVEGLGPFSVSATTQVVFSPGNLQFNAAQGEHQCADGTKQKGTWRFAEHQWDYIGNANGSVSSSYNGWIDLFGWGTSGWNSGAKAYQPYAKSTSYSDYYPGNNSNNNLTGAYANADWGIYNQIGGDAPGTWRTLTKDEWVYLFHGRANYANLFGLGTVNGVNGTIILPDNWVLPSGLTFNPSTGKGLSWSSTYYYNSNGNNFSHNTYTSAQWEKMEAAGAVFLPASGYRYGTSVYYVGTYGYYWSSTASLTNVAYDLHFSSYNLYPQSYDNRDLGFAVRLVSGL